MAKISTDQLFNFIVRNSHYYRPARETVEEKRRIYREDGQSFDKAYWALVESFVPCFHVDLVKLEKFLGEPFNYPKHIKPLEKLGLLISTHPWVNCFPHSKELAVQSEAGHGIVQDENKTLYFTYYLGKVNPNEGNKLYPWL